MNCPPIPPSIATAMNVVLALAVLALICWDPLVKFINHVREMQKRSR
jgi:hypothetical protein